MLVSVGDVRLFVDVDGAGLVPDGPRMRERPTVVLVHGSGGDHSPYKRNYAALAEFAQVVYYDQRGCGRSDDGPTERWTLDQWADDLRTLCEALGIDRPIVVGGSMGGAVALSYASRYSDHPQRLVIITASARVNPERSIAMYERLGGLAARQAAERFFADPLSHRDEYLRICGPYFSPVPGSPEVADRVVRRDQSARHFLANEFLSFDLRDRLGQIRCPVAVLVGELDPIVTVEDAEELAHAISSDVCLLRFTNAGHGLIGEHQAVLDLIRAIAFAAETDDPSMRNA